MSIFIEENSIQMKIYLLSRRKLDLQLLEKIQCQISEWNKFFSFLNRMSNSFKIRKKNQLLYVKRLKAILINYIYKTIEKIYLKTNFSLPWFLSFIWSYYFELKLIKEKKIILSYSFRNSIKSFRIHRELQNCCIILLSYQY